MSTRVYDWLDGTTDDEEADPALSCERSPSASLHRALERGDAARARLILDHHGGDALDVPRLAVVLPLVARLGLVSDALRAGLTADSMSPALQDVLVRSVVQANLPQDAAALLAAGFSTAQDTHHSIRLKALRSGGWREAERRLADK